MPERASPLVQGSSTRGLSQRPVAALLQYHAWPERFAEMAQMLATRYGAPAAPPPGKAVHGAAGALLRIHPQRLWLLPDRPDALGGPGLGQETGAKLDLSHARTALHVAEDIALPLLSRFVAIDLRPDRFGIDDLALAPLHRVGVVLWRRPDGIDILAPRSFARSIWDVLAEAAGRLG